MERRGEDRDEEVENEEGEGRIVTDAGEKWPTVSGALGLPEIGGKRRAIVAELAASPVIQRNEPLKTGLAVRRR